MPRTCGPTTRARCGTGPLRWKASWAGHANWLVKPLCGPTACTWRAAPLGFERGWMALHQMLAARPDGDMATGSLRGAQSAYPFNREYIYR